MLSVLAAGISALKWYRQRNQQKQAMLASEFDSPLVPSINEIATELDFPFEPGVNEMSTELDFPLEPGINEIATELDFPLEPGINEMSTELDARSLTTEAIPEIAYNCGTYEFFWIL